MKYIRTKEGYLLETIRESESGKSIITRPNGWIIHKDRVIKQADNIEELCDYELHYNSENELVIRKCKDVNFNILKSNLKSGYIKDVKLAILTDKGLIYVAKMNEKGELCLL